METTIYNLLDITIKYCESSHLHKNNKHTINLPLHICSYINFYPMNRILLNIIKSPYHIFSYVRTEIYSATRQVVSGLKYVADVELRRSLCVNDPRTKIAPCPEDISNPTRCIFTVVFQGWKSPQYTVQPSKCLR